jgi:hypothetical protein
LGGGGGGHGVCQIPPARFHKFLASGKIEMVHAEDCDASFISDHSDSPLNN